MAGLIGSGQLYRKRAIEGFGAVARMEAQTQMANDQIEAQEDAAEMQMLGTGAGIGGAVGVKKAMAAKKATAAVAPKGISASAAAANAPQGVAGLQYAPGGLEALGPLGGTPPGAIETISGATETARLAGETSAAVTKALGTSSAAAGGGTAGGVAGGTAGGVAGGTAGGVAGGTTAGASSGALATLGTIATPIAIGLGAAFLLNKLFG